MLDDPLPYPIRLSALLDLDEHYNVGRGGALGYKVMILTLMHGIEIETGLHDIG